MIQAGEQIEATVEREAPFGFFVSYEDTDILLHHNEVVGKVKVGDRLSVFLYHDHQDRLAATMHKPILRSGEMGWLEVTGVKHGVGAFVDNGLHKDVLVPKTELPKILDRWPIPGDQLYIKLGHDKQGRMLALPATEQDFAEMEKKAGRDILHKTIKGRVYKDIREGVFLFTEGDHIGFIHREEMTENPRLGQQVSARVIRLREDGRINLTMRAGKLEAYDTDAQMLWDHLTQRGGAMPYADQTDAAVIREKFNISKSAFKRALGKLMKEGKITQEDGWTYVKRDDLK